ncbi:hypothetical protein [Tistrella mobilis]|uniref:Uncharacterized protein n=1 Tax=Tistrella mobilis (strain KA081020-065) TaxID=1110502 RepID=I3TGL5_TISMK|nr:hypothetical protein [Tistrella mobilis]AFK51903.1 hypothetical protein TMO_0064 [Tistrella mobilis KA081020-065]
MSCKHLTFDATVTVARLEDIGQYRAEVRIHCSDCGLQFQFLGLTPGYQPAAANVSLDGLEANLAIAPKGSHPTPFAVLIGDPAARH